MEIDLTRVAGLVITVLAILIFSMLIVENEIPAFRYAENETPIMGQEVGQFLWDYRVIDLIAQAFVLFAAAACCVALLRTEERKR